ncbi:YgeY family selenium metabolism-linked hydrolase [Desulfosporosinus sp. FKA]|uniref:YgeY family selenium metabolism-linked hydrolase n=1 Tax=Desulfosporosinus sp. FKA TaxID=1969834 RepID=UPI000B49F2E3|nr:YgeY family selenium metabolism-linked hydrolase [Desulfosporosinus sp. FKA]
MDYSQVKKLSKTYEPKMIKFLSDMINISRQNNHEEQLILRIKNEMEKVGFDKITIDPMGNILGYIGTGQHLIALDAHIDTRHSSIDELWSHDPYQCGDDDQDGVINGLGGSGQEGGMASLVYAGKIIKDLNLDEDYTFVVVGSVKEGECDGLSWRYIIAEGNLRPEFVVLTEPTGGKIHLGHRGRMTIKVTTKGIHCQDSTSVSGDNAIYKMAEVLHDLRALNENLIDHSFLGKGNLTISQIFSTTPSNSSITDSCWIFIDRFLTVGENPENALNQIKNLPSVKAAQEDVEISSDTKSLYTKLIYPPEAYFSAWIIEEEHPIYLTLKDAYLGLFDEKPYAGKWTFPTNGAVIMGHYGIPCIGFGPGHKNQTNSFNERTWKSELADCAAMYASIPWTYTKKYANQMPKTTMNRTTE